jgi:dephospho-CoA kinase
MPRPLQVGITGGIGSGKSTVVKIFSCLNIPTYDADSRAKYLMNNNDSLVNQIRNTFGSESYDDDGNLNRRYLAEHVFGQPDQLQKLNDLVHPKVAEDYAEWVSNNEAASYIIKEAALLYESGSARSLDKIIVVTAPESMRVDRVMKRDNRSRSEIVSIMERQLHQDKLTSMADYIIANDESVLLIPQVLNLHQEFSSLKS